MPSVEDAAGPGPLIQSSVTRAGLAQVFSATLEPPDSCVGAKWLTPSQRKQCMEQREPGLGLRESFWDAVNPASDLALPEWEGHG